MGFLGAPWSSGVERVLDGSVAVAGVDVADLAVRFGTPLYVLDEADLRGRARAFREAFESAFAQVGADVDVYYAGKAFLSRAVARWVHDEGLGVDASTGGELAVALAAGVPGARIGLHGNNKSDDEIAAAIDAGVGRVVADSLVEVGRLSAAAAARGVEIPVMVRVTTGVHAGGHEHVATAHEDQKFGLSMAAGASADSPAMAAGAGADSPAMAAGASADSPAMAALLAVLAAPGLRLVGLHSHVGSQILDPAGFVVAARRVLELRAQLAARTGALVDEVDLGGGYGIAYLPGDEPLDPARVAQELATVATGACADLGTPLPRFSVEPGRTIVGPAGLTLYTVGTVKPVALDGGFVRTYVSVDGGMSDNIRPALYGARYHAELVSRSSDAPGVPARVVGKHCESGDIVVHDVTLPGDVHAGDLLAVPATGAYGRSMASNYNLVPRPAVVAVRDGDARVLVRRETLDDLLSLDQG
jgi:diaminopimelate decarboxylase